MTKRWSGASAGEVTAALEEFARRIAVFDPPPAPGATRDSEPGVGYNPARAAEHGPGHDSAYEPDGGAGAARAGGGASGGPWTGPGGGSGGGPGDDVPAGVQLRVDGGAVVRFSPGVARAFVEALRAYQDPRDRGSCDHCGGARLDDNFVCADCGQPSGLFGQLLRERAARYEGPAGELGG
jgi:hypothetical protein